MIRKAATQSLQSHARQLPERQRLNAAAHNDLVAYWIAGRQWPAVARPVWGKPRTWYLGSVMLNG
jgi:hypothetical protein